VGGGHHGLVAAALLADRGWSVLVLEEQQRPGGAVANAEVTAPGFASDLFSAFYPLSAVSPVLRRLRLHEHGLRWTHAPEVLAHVLPDDRAVLLSRRLATTAASVDAFGGGDGQRWVDLVSRWRAAREPLLAALLGPMPPLRPTAALVRRLGPAGVLRLARLATLSVRRLGEEEFVGPGGPLLLTGNALHSDIPATAPGSALLGWMLAMIGQDDGFPVPVGGAGAIADALLARVRAAGGQVRCGTRVERVLVRSGRAVGVVDASGQEYRARRAVVADVGAPQLYRRLLAGVDLPDTVEADLDRFTPDLATLKINWALDGPVPWTAPQARRAGTVHVGVDLDGLADQSHELSMGRVPAVPFLLVGQMTTADPTRSPAGTESLWAYLHLPPAVVADPETSTAVVREQVAQAEALLERHAPGFGARVLGRHVQGPHELQAGDSGLPLGAVNGGTAQLWQQLVFRPTPGLGRPETVVDRLFLASSAAHPGGAVHGVAGSNAAAAALLRDGWGRRALGRSLVAAQRSLAGG
jgi:phytoene dehydrogenase-like protein